MNLHGKIAAFVFEQFRKLNPVSGCFAMFAKKKAAGH
jgi:hypothetical protein